ncbi:dUTP diphosphatase [Metabacillus fastidiosus]|uniref:dUTP diphosphatase n=1 Tax=Metabacillus fastidiosus TaxID=1458 RepID=A0ABU6NU96_9BACI|nr:dUTP diphosphatase [Metabacillus fastidiosus]MED4399804.1 dUTP diphosphatase [Metabacillus fastidiosus]
MNVKIKRLSEHAVIPKYAKQGDSGFDLVAVEDVLIKPGETRKVPLGLAFEIPEGYELQIRPRSGITSKTKLRVQFGTVDAGYRGEIAAIVDNIGNDLAKVQKGDRIAQGVIAPVIKATFEETDELSESERGDKGFGFTGVTI